MRLIVYGVGAIGGVVAAAVARAGGEVIGIARGARLEALRANGLRLRTPDLDARVTFPVVEGPEEIAFRPRDAVMLAMKTQHATAALERLRAAGWRDGPIFCAQNGVANEELALRVFPNVHGIVVMMPASFEAMDEALAFSTPRHGIFDVGRYLGGVDADDEAMARLLEASNIAAFADAEVMAGKYGKLLMNLGNMISAALGPEAKAPGVARAVRAEGEAVLAAAGIAWRDVGAADPRRDPLMRQGEITGAARSGGSTAQSLARGAGSVETDYLNGEIALIARRAGVPAPLNARLAEIGARLARAGARPGAMTPAALAAELREAAGDLPDLTEEAQT